MARFDKTKTPGILKGPDGNEYHNVWKRVWDFREKFPASDGWGITTQLVSVGMGPADGHTTKAWRATVHKAGDETCFIYGTGHSDPLPPNLRQHEFKKNETVAIGRCLASLGFVSAGSYASADEMEGIDLSPNMPSRAPERTEKPSHRESLQYESPEPDGRSEMGTDCPECNGPMWDNRPDKANGSKKSTYPDLKCRDRDCGKVIWLN